MSRNHINSKRKIRAVAHEIQSSITTYDNAMGIIRIIDTSVDASIAPSISPIKLNRSLRRDIKKTVIAKNV